MSVAKPQSTQQTVAIRAKEAEVLRRRIVGQPFRDIAAEMGYSVGGAYEAFKRAMAATVIPVQEAADELRAMQRERIDADLAAIEPRRALGEPEAIRVHQMILKAQRELEGLDAPAKFTGDVKVLVEISGADDV